MRSLLWIIATAGVAGGCASYEIDGMVGYSSVQADAPDGVSPFFDDDAGVRFAGNLSRSLVTPGLIRGEGGNGPRINLNLSGSTYEGDNNAELFVLSPQIGPSFRLSGFGLFAEAGATAGAAYASIDLPGDDDEQFSWAVRPYLRAGIVNERLFLGIEGGYERTGLDFDLPGASAAGEDYENWYVGIVAGLRLTQ